METCPVTASCALQVASCLIGQLLPVSLRKTEQTESEGHGALEPPDLQGPWGRTVEGEALPWVHG